MQAELTEGGAPSLAEVSMPWRQSVVRGAAGLLLAAGFGAAAGVRYGVSSALVHGLGVPLAYVAAVGVVVPALFVALSYAHVVVAPRDVLRICADAVFSAGRLLAGLAPAALMLCVSVERDVSAALIVGAALGFTGLHALRRFVVQLDALDSLDSSLHVVRRRALLALFCVVVGATALRVWWLALPMGGGAS